MHTGGETFGCISTKSSPIELAAFNASLIDSIPNCLPWESIHRTCWAEIDWLILGPSLAEKLGFESFILISPIIIILKYTF